MKSVKEASCIDLSTPPGSSIVVVPIRSNPIRISSIYDANKANPVKAADPIAKPFPVAAVVFPSESNASVRLLTSAPNPLISALPPALSAIGPYASVANVMPNVDNIPTAAIPIPYNPIPTFAKSKPDANQYDNIIPVTTAITGIAVETMPKPTPEIITVAGPVLPLSDNFLVGL